MRIVEKSQLMSAPEIDRTLQRLAHEIVEKTGGKSGDYHRPIRKGTGRRRENQKGSKGNSFSAKRS